MNNQPFIPEASDPDTFVRGRLAPAGLARRVRTGWKTGIAYLVFQLLGMVLVLTTGLATPFSALLLLGELALSCALVYGVYRWHAVAAWLLFALLIVSALGAAAQPPQFQTPGMATFRIAFLVGFGVAFGRAAMAIRSFNKGAANA